VTSYWSLGDLPLGGPRRVVAIGTFDGVHAGHQAIFARARELAAERGLPMMVVTFEPNPISVLRPELKPTVLTPIGVKEALIAGLGVDELLVIPFNASFSRIRAERFAEMLISAPIGAEAIVVGENFRFGHRGAGTAEMLRQFGRARGLVVETPELVVSPDGKPVSSTRIRRLIDRGEVAEAATLLTRPHALEGEVVHGAGRGAAMGIPTANLEVPGEAAVPERGVYAGRVAVDGLRATAAINVGFAPTFQEAPAFERPRIEAFLLDYDGGDLYGRRVTVEFLERLRPERRFPDPEALVAQIREDVARTREIAAADG
jgi:riboflavin kinase/FMN adenylyltransferase